MRIYKFNGVVGNTNVVHLLKKSLERKTYSHFTIMRGVSGTGKSTCAEITALSLTCENPQGAEPCLACKTCLTNVRGMQKTGEGLNVIKKNLGKLNTKRDMDELIKEIFTLQSAIGNNVYILEEIHVLNENQQTSLLEEIDRLDENTYVIVCTTRPYKLLEELRNRAISFNFSRLTNKESGMLFDKTCEAMGIQKIDKETRNMIISKSKGVPRELVKLIQFVVETEPTVSEVSDFLGYINTEDFSNLLSLGNVNTMEFLRYYEELLSRYTYDTVLEQFKSYILKVTFYVTGGIKDDLTKFDISTVNDCLTKAKLFKICKVMESVSSRNSTETDLKMAMLRVSQIMMDNKLSDIVVNNSKNAAVQKIEASKLHEDLTELKKDEINSSLNKMSLHDIKQVLK